MVRCFLRFWYLACLFVLTLSPAALAEERHVCVRPPGVPANVGRWVYDNRDKRVILSSESELRQQSAGKVVYVYDPQAPPGSTSFLPAKHRDLTCPDALPAPVTRTPSALGSAAAPRPVGGLTAPDGQGSGHAHSGRGSGQSKSTAEKVASELAYGAALASGQLNENDKRPDGKRYGVIGRNNPDGPNNPVAQASASLIVIVASVLSVEGFEKLVKDALEKKARLMFTEKTFSKETLDFILQSKRARFFADALAKNGAIGPYSVMSKFTQKLGGQWQAHHILEVQMFEKFTLGDAALAPSVILSDVEHKLITAELANLTPKAKTVKELWKAYEKAYGKKRPHWLSAIKPYFQGK